MGACAAALSKDFEQELGNNQSKQKGTTGKTLGEVHFFPQRKNKIEDGPEARQSCIANLYHNYADIMRGHLALHGQNESDAADIIQDVFTRIIRIRDLSRIMENPKAYLLKAAVNMMRDRYRHDCARKARAHDPFEHQVIVSQEPSPESQAIWGQAMVVILRALRSAGPCVPDVVSMSYLGGLTYPEIALRFGVTPRTVERYMQRARSACMENAADLPILLPSLETH